VAVGLSGLPGHRDGCRGTIVDVSGPPFEMVFQEIPVFVYGDAAHCSDCSRVHDDMQAVVPSGTPAPTFDVSLTLDGAMIATDAFVAATRDLPGARFTPLEGAAGNWMFDVVRIVEIEPFDSNVRWGPVCERCHEPRYVTRSGPIRLADGVEIEAGFSRTAIGFGDTADFGERPVRLRPHVLLDRATGRNLKSAGLLGIHLISQP
jgi:hypothetical protein